MTNFIKLNDGWNAEPNAPYPEVSVEGSTLILAFYLDRPRARHSSRAEVGELRFESCWRYRPGETNDEGWWRRQCRFSLLAPAWGEFYEVSGDLGLDRLPVDAWSVVSAPVEQSRHFLFYFRDETFECDAVRWSFHSPATAIT